MIKHFDYTFGNETISLCASFGAGPALRRVLVSRADSMATLVVLEDDRLVERAIRGRAIVEAAL